MIEIFDCYRHFGHPIVNELENVKDLRSNSQKSIEVDKNISRDVSGAFNRMFILSFISKNNRWPQCYLSEDIYSDRDCAKSDLDPFKKLINNRPKAFFRSEPSGAHRCVALCEIS